MNFLSNYSKVLLSFIVNKVLMKSLYNDSKSFLFIYKHFNCYTKIYKAIEMVKLSEALFYAVKFFYWIGPWIGKSSRCLKASKNCAERFSNIVKVL